MRNDPLSNDVTEYLRALERRIRSLETKETGTIYLDKQLIVEGDDGVKTIIGDLSEYGEGSGIKQWIGDTTPPPVPTTPIVTPSVGLFSITWDGLNADGEPTPPDFNRLEVIGSSNSIDTVVGVLRNKDEAAVFADVVYGEVWSFSFVAVDHAGNRSEYSVRSPDYDAQEVIVDEEPPPVASTPVLTLSMGSVHVRWDGLGSAGETMPNDFLHTVIEHRMVGEVEWSSSSAIARSAGYITLSALPAGTLEARLVTVDTFGNAAEPSAVASIQVVPIETAEDVREEIIQVRDDAATALDDQKTALTTAFQTGDTDAIDAAKTHADNLAKEAVHDTLIEYALGTETTAPTSGWSATSPTRTPGSYIWMRTTVTYGDGTITVLAPALLTGNDGAPGEDGLQGLQGEDGAQGLRGEDGADGTPSYTHVAYANNSTGTSGFSTSDPNRTYIGIAVSSDPTDPTTPSSYNWSLIKGADGTQGIAGPTGDDGQTSYLHIAYATNSTGTTGFSTTVSAGKTYIGQYTDFTAADSSTPSLYSWTLIKGDTGEQGISITSVTPYYRVLPATTAQPAKPTTLTPTGWGTTEPTYAPDTKLWKTERIVYSNGTFSYTDVSLSSAYAAADAVKIVAAADAQDKLDQARAEINAGLNLIQNTAVTGRIDRWGVGTSSAHSVEAVDFQGTTVDAHRVDSSGNVLTNSDNFPVDITKAYEVRLWYKDPSQSAGTTSSQLYIGLYTRDASGALSPITQVNRTLGSIIETTNPYWAHIAGPTPEWRELVGYLLPYGTDPELAKTVGNGTYTFIMGSATSRMSVRWLNYFNSGTERTAWVTHQTVTETTVDAIARAHEAQKRADAAHEAAGDAQESANLAADSANGKNTIMRSLAGPSGVGTVVGDVWTQFKDSTYSVVIGQWTWGGGASSSGWKKNTLSHETISSLDVGSLTVIGQSRLADVVSERFYSDVIVGNTGILRKLVVSDSTNIIDDPELTGNGWGLDGSGSSTYGWSIANTTGGPGSALWITSGDRIEVYNSREIVLEPNADGTMPQFEMSFRSRVDRATQAIFRIYWYDYTGSSAGNATDIRISTTVGSTWENQTGTVTPPVEARTGRISFVVAPDTGTAPSVWLINPSIRRKTGTILLEDGAITAEKMNFISPSGVDRLRVDKDGLFIERSGVKRITMDHQGFLAKNTAGQDTFKIDTATGNVEITGKVTITSGSVAESAIPVLDQSKVSGLDTSLGAKLDSATGIYGNRTHRDVHSLYWSASSGTGAIIIQTTIPVASSIMPRIRIQGAELARGGTIDTTVSFYAYSLNGGTIHSPQVTSDGERQVSVRLATNASDNIAIILTPTNGVAWGYPRLTVSEYQMGYQNLPATAENWTHLLGVTEATISADFSRIVSPPSRDLEDTNFLTQKWRQSGTTKIDGGHLENDSITSGVIHATQGITSRHTITGATFQTTTATNRGVMMNSSGVQGWNSVGTRTFMLDTNGKLTAQNVDLTGKITATSGEFTGTISSGGGISLTGVEPDSGVSYVTEFKEGDYGPGVYYEDINGDSIGALTGNPHPFFRGLTLWGVDSGVGMAPSNISLNESMLTIFSGRNTSSTDDGMQVLMTETSFSVSNMAGGGLSVYSDGTVSILGDPIATTGSWQHLSYNSGWGTRTPSTSWPSVGLRARQEGNTVRLDGVFGGGTGSSGVIAQLPAGMRPAKTKIVNPFVSSGADSLWRFEVRTSGDLAIIGSYSSSGYISLDGVTIPLD